MKLEKCCCCIPLEAGVFFIGAMTMMSLLGEYYYFQLTRTLLTFVAVLAFFYMLSFDSAGSRGAFFFAWLIATFGFYFINIFIAKEEEGGYDPRSRA